MTRAPYAASTINDSAGFVQQVGAFQDVYEVGANYNETFGDWLVKGSLGWEGGKAERTSATDINTYNDLNSLQVGALIGYNPWNLQIGGGFVDNFKTGYRKNNNNLVAQAFETATQYGPKDQTAWNIGAQYTWGPAVFGVKFLEQTDAGDLLSVGSRTLDAVTAGTMYTIAPGLRTGLEYTYFSAKSDVSLDLTNNTTGTKQTGSVVLVRGIVNF